MPSDAAGPACRPKPSPRGKVKCASALPVPMPPSLFCEHKRLVSVCPLCGAARAGAATPMRGPVLHDVDDTIHAFRATCHARIADYLTRVQGGEAPGKAYAAVYPPAPRGRDRSEEEDTATFRGGFYRAMVKMFDITIQDRRIQGYNGLADWDEMRDYVFRKLPPVDLEKALREGLLQIHGGNGAWPRQQIASELLRSDAVQEAVLDVAFGANGVPAGEASDEDIVARLERADALAVRAGGRPNATPLFSKVLHILAPTRWPALTPRATPEVGEDLGVAIPEVKGPRDYLGFAEAMRALAASRKHADLGRTDMLVADTAAMLEAEE